jgi:hypothetical protein
MLALFVMGPLTLSEQVLTLLNIMIGTLAAKFGDVVQFDIGSSAGSRSKEQALVKIAGSGPAEVEQP